MTHDWSRCLAQPGLRSQIKFVLVGPRGWPGQGADAPASQTSMPKERQRHGAARRKSGAAFGSAWVKHTVVEQGVGLDGVDVPGIKLYLRRISSTEVHQLGFWKLCTGRCCLCKAGLWLRSVFWTGDKCDFAGYALGLLAIDEAH